MFARTSILHQASSATRWITTFLNKKKDHYRGFLQAQNDQMEPEAQNPTPSPTKTGDKDLEGGLEGKNQVLLPSLLF